MDMSKQIGRSGGAPGAKVLGPAPRRANEMNWAPRGGKQNVAAPKKALRFERNDRPRASPDHGAMFDDFKAEVAACGLMADWGGARLEKLFALFDLDGNGRLDANEFKAAARQLCGAGSGGSAGPRTACVPYALYIPGSNAR